jgi:hypothetical protein
MIDTHESCTHCFITYNCCNCLQIQGSTAARRLSLHARRTVVLYVVVRQVEGGNWEGPASQMSSNEFAGSSGGQGWICLTAAFARATAVVMKHLLWAFFKITVSFSPLSSVLYPWSPSSFSRANTALVYSLILHNVNAFQGQHTTSRGSGLCGWPPLPYLTYCTLNFIAPKSHANATCKYPLGAFRRLSWAAPGNPKGSSRAELQGVEFSRKFHHIYFIIIICYILAAFSKTTRTSRAHGHKSQRLDWYCTVTYGFFPADAGKLQQFPRTSAFR